MKKSKFNFSVKRNLSRVFFALLVVMVITQSCKKDEPNTGPEIVDDSLSIAGPEDGLAIYINGKNSTKVTPTKIVKEPGTYNISVFSNTTEKLYGKEVEVVEGEPTTVIFTNNDVATREWKCLVVGFKSATDGAGTYTYTEEELDKIYNNIKTTLSWVDNNCYNAMKWVFEKKYIDETVELTESNISPATFNAAVTDIAAGDYDFIIAISTDGSQWGGWWPLPESNINALNAKASYVSWSWVEPAEIDATAEYYISGDGQGTIVHHWLRTITQNYYPNMGVIVPTDKEDQSEVMWRAEQYGYTGDNYWYEWYEDMLKGTVEGKYGIGPQALYGMSPRAYSLGEIGK